MPNTPDKESPAWLTAAIVVLCLVSTSLMLTLPAESLIVDLVYQVF
jgi:hypothetical protein